jgi:hypothetical protein
MQDSRTPMLGGAVRWLILGSAFALGSALMLMPDTGIVRAADLPAPRIVAQAGTPPGKAANGQKTPAAEAPADESANAGADDDDADTDKGASKGDVTIDEHGVVIRKGGKHLRIQGFGRDREYDSFEQFVQDAPWLATLVFLFVLMVFLVPLLIIVLLIWYKLRKNRLANETMLKLAERGVMPPAAAMDAVASGNAPTVAAAVAPSGAPAYEQARLAQRRAVWSDLRKGIILGAIGLGLTMFSMLDDGTPNSVGLIFLFVGLGYCLLWYFEDRTGTPRRDSSGTPPAGGA